MPLSFIAKDIDAEFDIVGIYTDVIASIGLADLIASGGNVPTVPAAEKIRNYHSI